MKFVLPCTLAAAIAAVCWSTGASAAYSASAGGWTEVIGCPTSSWSSYHWGHAQTAWGSRGAWVSYDSGTPWWTYAHAGGGGTDCDQWANGSLIGGATYVPGSPSVPQNVNVTVSTFWYDFNQPSSWTDSTKCGHQHASSYVWGWRYLGSSWAFEFVKAHQTTTYWDAAAGRCKMKAAGNPSYPPPFDGYAFGPEVITINNSPYAVLYTKTQASSHYNAGCGQFECFHRVLAIASY
ncbi:MAG: hypothetical protein K0R38_588 [Polyangiaceae bacterium]|jgi:hypothetical protein|nr:hypothetical protein [Polyangiaceae bacterium]